MPGFSIEVVYCQANKQSCVSLQVEEGCTIAEAVEDSRLLTRFGLALEGDDPALVGIFGKQVTHDTVLKRGDRVEIYRPLLLSPTEARRLRAQTRSAS